MTNTGAFTLNLTNWNKEKAKAHESIKVLDQRFNTAHCYRSRLSQFVPYPFHFIFGN